MRQRGQLDLDRLRRLANRVLAVQHVIDGADFIQLYRWFLDRSPSPEQAFESSRRIFRGAPLDGGAPFTKDCGYLSGLLGVTTFMRAAFAAGRADTLGLLFAGKVDLSAIPALAELRSRGMCLPGRYLPPWAADIGCTSWAQLLLKFVLSHPAVSRRHARITMSGSMPLLEDLQSANGTYVNNARVDRVTLKPGDIVRFGADPACSYVLRDQ